ncbi:MAG: hypothetical protein ACRDPY_34815 [Streptosporangiaceae bacterium]
MTMMVMLPAALAVVLVACGFSGSTASAAPAAPAAATHSAPVTRSELSLYLAMRTLWEQHMEFTYDTVAAFAAGSKALTPTLDRLLQNQSDIGNAVKPFYGTAAGNELTRLLRTHILDYVPVLEAAKAGNKAGVEKAFAAVLANGVQVGKFLEHANPRSWPAPEMEQMMTVHNDQTLQYAADQLEGKYAASIAEYGKAEAHMQEMSDMLSAGIIRQFPRKFAS